MKLLLEIWNLWCDMAPYLVFGLVIAGLIHVFLSKEQIAKQIGGQNLSSVVKASLFGIPLPLCSCGVLPTGLSLYREGGSKGAVVSFFISTPQTGVDSILVTYGFLGPLFAVVRPIAAFVGGVIGGVIANRWAGENKKDNLPLPQETCNTSRKPWFVESLRYGFVDFLYNFAHYLVIGIVLAGIITYFTPKDFFASTMGTGALSMFVMLMVGIPFYVCSTASVPIAYAMLLKGLSPGAALVFLMAGPATNMATITSITGIMGWRVTLIYLGTITVTALAFGALLNAIYHLVPVWFPINGAHAGTMLPPWVRVFSAIILTLATGYALFRRFRSNLQSGSTCSQSGTCDLQASETITLQIGNMNCSHCAAKVEKVLSEAEGVSAIRVDVLKGEGTVKGDGIDREKILKLLAENGYPSRIKDS